MELYLIIDKLNNNDIKTATFSEKLAEKLITAFDDHNTRLEIIKIDVITQGDCE